MNELFLDSQNSDAAIMRKIRKSAESEKKSEEMIYWIGPAGLYWSTGTKSGLSTLRIQGSPGKSWKEQK